jgi:hypothetical protein
MRAGASKRLHGTRPLYVSAGASRRAKGLPPNNVGRSRQNQTKRRREVYQSHFEICEEINDLIVGKATKQASPQPLARSVQERGVETSQFSRRGARLAPGSAYKSLPLPTVSCRFRAQALRPYSPCVDAAAPRPTSFPRPPSEEEGGAIRRRWPSRPSVFPERDE